MPAGSGRQVEIGVHSKGVINVDTATTEDVKNQAQKLGVSPERLLAALKSVGPARSTAVDGSSLSLEDRAAVRIASLTAFEQSAAATDLLYRLAGSSAIKSSPLERCCRDVHTAAQHLHVQDGRWETAGRRTGLTSTEGAGADQVARELTNAQIGPI